MGQDRGRDRLEELQRRPRQHQHVEDEAGLFGALEAADDQRPGVEEGLFAEHDQQHRRREAAAVGEGEVLLPARPRRRPSGRAGRVAGLAASFFARRAKANGTTSSESAGAAVIPIATADWPLSTLIATSTAKTVRKQDSERIRATKRPKRCAPGEEAAGEVAGGVEEDRGEEDPVEGFVAFEDGVLDRPAQGQRQHREEQREAELDRRGDPHRLVDRFAAGDPLGDVAAEQLFDRPVEGGDGDEDRRPEDRDLPVVGLRERVRGDQEVGVGDDPGEPDPDREEARRFAVVGRARRSRPRRRSPPSRLARLRHRSSPVAALVVRGLDPERQLDPPHPLEGRAGSSPAARPGGRR